MNTHLQFSPVFNPILCSCIDGKSMDKMENLHGTIYQHLVGGGGNGLCPVHWWTSHTLLEMQILSSSLFFTIWPIGPLPPNQTKPSTEGPFCSLLIYMAPCSFFTMYSIHLQDNEIPLENVSMLVLIMLTKFAFHNIVKA